MCSFLPWRSRLATICFPEPITRGKAEEPPGALVSDGFETFFLGHTYDAQGVTPVRFYFFFLNLGATPSCAQG